MISESGISSKQDIEYLYANGVKSFLVGETLMKQNDLQKAVGDLLN